MRIITFILALVMLGIASPISAQSRKELKEEVSQLNERLKDCKKTEGELTVAQNRIASLDAQVNSLKETNQGLLDNMNNFLSTSKQQSNSISRTLEALRKKENQIKGIRDNFSSQDSIAFAVLTDFKRTLGENAQVGVEKGSIIVKMDNPYLFGSKEGNSVVEENAKDFINRIAATLKKYETLSVSVETGGGDWGINALRASSVAKLFEEEYEVKGNRLKVTTKSNGQDYTLVHLHPDFNEFYLEVRDELKKSN
ncbi:conserved oligomeric Golgi complex subunit 6 [Galbibacter mesophilus]|uniref:hypothetical protein n=1 Tax=Galbibacter mesophilus TaxID=379069 RepID=UPI00191F7958|nr:hypothetical protein [Galbibacter mesophilus]MCM5662936.1 hypothetical protein [Galbibacter mesophilus]